MPTWRIIVSDIGIISTALEAGAISGVMAGQTRTFTITFVPPNGVLRTIPQVSTTDLLVTLGPVGVPGPNKFTVTVDASNTRTFFDVVVTAINTSGATIRNIFRIPILPLVKAVDFGLSEDG